ncbi:glycosyltransferase [Nocardioides sp. CFH 31398]|uniref:glycosyltransferase n=1 Tax=Nocardioides sp. CFH 31398 TaxID=2919579 RepID=UPI001F055F04|nr:glycosyltransferase [Nocardioides sp. CFH 31398]MCH1867667.1 glycosyltransferase [Nocardioides sp. CFH 31398]
MSSPTGGAGGDPRPLRVTFVVPDLAVGGAERHVVDLLTRLDRDVVEPRVVCLGEPGRLFDAAAGVAPATSFGHARRDVLRSVVALARQLRASGTDVVVARGYSAELVGRVAATLARVPRSVVWVHNCGSLTPRGRLRALADRLLDPVTDAYFGVADRQVPYLVDELGYPEAKVRVLHNGVDVDAFGRPEDLAARDAVRADLGLAPDDVAIGILAALRPEKEHELLLAAVRRVVAVVPRARLVVVGDGDRRAELEARAAALGLGDAVVFAGYRSDVPQVLAALDVSTLASSAVECFPISLLEAMATGLPAVCTDVGGVAEILVDGETGFLVASRDEAALADRLAALAADPDLRRRMGAAGQARVRQRFTLTANVRETERRLAGLRPAGRRTSGRGGRPVELAIVMDTTAVGGAENVVLAMCAALDPARVRARLVCLREEGPLADDFRRVGVPVTALRRTGRFDLRTVPRLVRALRGADAVLVSHHHRASLVLARAAGRLAGVRHALVAAHDMGLVGLGGRVLPASTVATLRWLDALVLLAPSQGRYLHDEEGVGRRPWSRTREVVVPNGIALPPPVADGAREAARATLGLPHDAFVVGVVARLSAQKAHHVLLEAFVSVRDAVPGARLVVVGEGDRGPELERLAHDLGLADAVLFTGVRRDVADLLPGFDVLALSSVHEAAPLVVIEAMAAGLPVVATDCGALRDMVDDPEQGRLVAVGDRRALAEALVGLARDPDGRRRAGAAARRRAERDFDVAATARGYEDLLAEVTGLAPGEDRPPHDRHDRPDRHDRHERHAS